MPETQWMTLTETADMMKTLPEQVTQMCEDGKLEYYMEDGRYFVSRESIDLFMHPPIGQTAPANPDSNGTPRRQYGRAPHGVEPLPEPASDTQAVNGPDEPGGGGGSAPEDDTEETPGSSGEVAETAEDARAVDGLAEAEDARAVDGLAEAEDARAVDGLADTEREETGEESVDPAEDAQPVESAHSEDDEIHIEPIVDAASSDEVLSDEIADPEPTIQDGEHAEATEDPGEHVEAAEDPGEPDVRVAEILADLRAALTRHAREHKAFCDEIAALADALESTLSRDDDKTSELTREISSLLARYTRR